MHSPDPNKKPPKEKWNGLYGSDSYFFGKEPSDFVKHHAENLVSGKLLDVGMGEGRNAVFLAQKGFQVSGLDASDKGVEKANALAGEKGVSIEGKTQNLDFYLMPLMGFQSVVMTYFRPQPRFFTEIRRGLAQGGTFLLEGYTTEHLKANPGHEWLEIEDCFKPNEALTLMQNKFHVLYYKEMEEGGQHIVQAIAKKVGA